MTKGGRARYALPALRRRCYFFIALSIAAEEALDLGRVFD
jgi:hypothetical protein